MKEVLSIFFEKLVNGKNGFKIIAWIFVFLIIIAIVIYPIIDANFLYYNRTNKRIDIIQKVIGISTEDIKSDKRIEEEYNSILNDMNKQNQNYINNIFVTETSPAKNMAKFISGAWLFALVGLIMPFSKDKKSGKRFSANNIGGAILCLVIAGVIGYICMKIPSIINVGINIVLYQIILIFLAYTISTSGKKAQ